MTNACMLGSFIISESWKMRICVKFSFFFILKKKKSVVYKLVYKGIINVYMWQLTAVVDSHVSHPKTSSQE